MDRSTPRNRFTVRHMDLMDEIHANQRKLAVLIDQEFAAMGAERTPAEVVRMQAEILNGMAQAVAQDSLIDRAAELIGYIAHQIELREWGQRVVRETVLDQARLRAAGLLTLPAAGPQEAA